MLSVIMYGRNDAHGYNLHKRAAISLNCIAELLVDPSDEIVFVDYNSPDELPTFLEAIHDTLTDKARQLIRLLRVREYHHARFSAKTHLNALEPVARNVALRRSNPANRWVLSTNTDMIFAPRNGLANFSEVLADIAPGFYHLPRFELPEGLWEALNRLDPISTIAATRSWASAFHLNEIVYTVPTVLYDAPGDFQLALREDLFEICGFDEEMLLGWHVDSNLAKRMGLLRGGIMTLVERLAGYHCDHTRVATALHGNDRLENDWKRFIDDVKAPGLIDQASTWGMPDEPIEEYSLRTTTSTRYVEALTRSISLGSTDEPFEAFYDRRTFNQLEYDVDHALPFVLDALSCAVPGSRIAYAGARSDFLQKLAAGAAVLIPSVSFTVLGQLEWLRSCGFAMCQSFEEWLRQADIFMFEVGVRPDGSAEEKREHVLRSAQIVGTFLRLARTLGRTSPVRVIAVNAVHNTLEQHVWCNLRCSTTPFSSRVRHGYLAPARAPGLPDQRLAPWLGCFGTAAEADPWAIECMALLAGVDEVCTVGGTERVQHALYVAPHPDRFPNILTSLGLKTDVADPRFLMGQNTARDWRSNIAYDNALVPRSVGLFAPGTKYGLIFCPNFGSPLATHADWARLAEVLRQSLSNDGVLAISVHPHLTLAAAAGGDDDTRLTALISKTMLLNALCIPKGTSPAPANVYVFGNASVGTKTRNDGLSLPATGATQCPRSTVFDCGGLEPGLYLANVGFEICGILPTVPSVRLKIIMNGDQCVADRPCTFAEIKRGEIRHAFRADRSGSYVIMLLVEAGQALELKAIDHALHRKD